MKRLLGVLMIVALAALMIGAGFTAYFTDTETPRTTNFTAGTLDLNVEGSNVGYSGFDLRNMRPERPQFFYYMLSNRGTIDGSLDIADFRVTGFENACEEPEREAGDISCSDPGPDQGELQEKLVLSFYRDVGCDRQVSSGDGLLRTVAVRELSQSLGLAEPMPAGSILCLAVRVDWSSSSDDNLAQGDSIDLGLSFVLSQTAE